VRDALAVYHETLPTAYRALLGRYELQDAAIKVVGVGSVGTLCWVLLLTAGGDDPLFLQVKEARASVLEPYAGKSVFQNQGQRIVDGYRRMQPASDMFLGWSRGPKRDFFIRQLRDMKLSPMVETFGQVEMDFFATWCGKAVALSHARSGNSAMISGYLGKSDAFDQALAAFAKAYADQNEKDHAALDKAVRKGAVKAVFEEDR
jgi:threonine dehydrogenase-like Zn-dependent dehydrogenase